MSTRQASTKNTPNNLPLIGLAHRNVDLVGMNPWMASYRDSMLKYTRQGGGGNGGTDIDMSTYDDQIKLLLASSKKVEKMLTELLNRANTANDQRAETALKEMQFKMERMKELHKIEIQGAQKAFESYKKAMRDAELAQNTEQEMALRAREADLAEQEAKLAEQQAAVDAAEELLQLFYEMPRTPQDNNVGNFSDSNRDQEEDEEGNVGYVEYDEYVEYDDSVEKMAARHMKERAQEVEKLQEEEEMAENLNSQQEWSRAQVERIRETEKKEEEEEEKKEDSTSDYADPTESEVDDSGEDDSKNDLNLL